MIKKGRVTSVYDNNTYRVESIDIPGDVTLPLKLQEGMTPSLKKDDEVVYVLFSDQTGLIIGRL